MGCCLSARQEDLLLERFDRVVLLLDADPAGLATLAHVGIVLGTSPRFAGRFYLGESDGEIVFHPDRRLFREAGVYKKPANLE